MRVASGVSFPPMEFFDTDNKTVLGFDADLGKALGQVLGVKFDFQNTNFDGIIGGLNAGRYDLGLTSMIDKKARQETVDFVDYLNSGVTFMVAKGNPKGLKDKLDLCGKTAAVEKSSTGDLSVDDITKACLAAGKPAVTKQPFPDQASAVQALQSGRADAVVALDLTLAYNVKTSPQSFQVDAKPFGTLPVGIPVPKKDPQLRDAVQGALKKVIASGTYDAAARQVEPAGPGVEGRSGQHRDVTMAASTESPRPRPRRTPTSRLSGCATPADGWRPRCCSCSRRCSSTSS